MVIVASESSCFNSIFDFVNTFSKDMKKKFKKKYGVTINKWDFQECDQDAISNLLEDEPDKYVLEFIEDGHDGFFQVIKLEGV